MLALSKNIIHNNNLFNQFSLNGLSILLTGEIFCFSESCVCFVLENRFFN